MNKREFQYIKGQCQPGRPADICFYTDVDSWSVSDFIFEFDYLVNYVNPSKIRIHINSIGGNCVEGMSVFSKIMDCTIPTECINDGLAASMGSIIWAAGDELYMKDYALLMIHNPFCEQGESPEIKQVIEAFTQQLKTVYTKRFSLSEEDVEAIMNGKEGEDGTFLTVKQAIEKGFVKPENVIETPKVVKEQVQAALKNTKDIAKIKAVYGLAVPTLINSTINEQKIKTEIKSKTKTMEKNDITVFAALLGITGEKATADNVSATINELKAKAEKCDSLQKTLDDTKAELTKITAEFTGAQTTVQNLTEDLNKTKEALKVYEEAEAKAKDEKVNALINQAVADCKINKEEREIYLKMAQNDYDLAEQVLAKIPARDNLGRIIAKANEQKPVNDLKSEEEQILAKVQEVVGADFKFRNL